MDLPTLEYWAIKWRHAVVLFSTFVAISGVFAYYFSVKRNETRRLQFQLAAAILAIFAAGSTALNFYYSNETTIERDKLARENEMELERFKLDKSREIKILETENLRRREQLEIVEKSNLKAAKEVASLQIDVAAAKRKQADAETELAKVKKRQEPRVAPESLIADILLTAPPAEVILLYQQGSPESRLFAADMHDALRMGGWKVLEVKGLASITERGAGRGDFTFSMRNLEDNPPMRALKLALLEAGFKFSGIYDPELPDNTLRLIINPKQ